MKKSGSKQRKFKQDGEAGQEEVKETEKESRFKAKNLLRLMQKSFPKSIRTSSQTLYCTDLLLISS